MTQQKISRRSFVRMTILSATGAIASACARTAMPGATATPSPASTPTPGAAGQQARQPQGNAGTPAAAGQKPAQQGGGKQGPPPAGQDSGTTVRQQVGLTLNTGKAFAGYTLFAPKHYTSTYLIDNKGQLVHTWTGSQCEPGQSAYLLESGHLLRAAMTKGPLSTGGGEGGRVEEYDWDSNLVWEFDYSTAEHMQHHDIHVLPNGNILMLAVEKRTYDEAIAAGFDPSKLDKEVRQRGMILPDTVVEVKPTYPSGGEVVWEWRVWDHLVQDRDQSKANYGDVAAHPELIQADDEGQAIPSFWNHMNSIDYNAVLDQVLLSVRGSSEVWIIDHSTTTTEAAGHSGGKRGKGGDLRYRWGNPATYDRGTRDSQKLYQQHDAEWVAPGLPGAGNITIFNNGLGRNYSTIDEFVPPVDANGNYALKAGQPFGPADLSWTYKANPPESLFSEAISGAQRLPNGNTLICDGVHGTFSEVASSGEVVWKYINPVVRDGPLAQGAGIPTDAARAGELMNAVFRVYRYAPDHPGLVGKTLTPVGTLEK